MEPITFPEQNTTWAKYQKSYKPLPSYTDQTETISCWRLTFAERFRLLITGRLWLRQMTFGAKLQPQCPSVERPFVN